ncbi:unnamed protein product [Peronospora farinosa]|uniref:Uncharacterized protein n=1 Tax=Peronospora farinosa TaxID=134698 RepID=A0AAV0SUW3_9STRA|nr:unnamed protein product [Peronospora farinosa]
MAFCQLHRPPLTIRQVSKYEDGYNTEAIAALVLAAPQKPERLAALVLAAPQKPERLAALGKPHPLQLGGDSYFHRLKSQICAMYAVTMKKMLWVRNPICDKSEYLLPERRRLILRERKAMKPISFNRYFSVEQRESLGPSWSSVHPL